VRFAPARKPLRSPDMTPMIDVTFLLLIFFLLTAQMAERSRGDVRLPVEAGESRLQDVAAGLVVLIDQAGDIRVGQQSMAAAQLAELARQAASRDGAAVPVVRADRDAPVAALNAVARALRQGGAPSFRLATDSGGRR
jgi:biopolymer transport protein ExbD